MSAIDPYVYDAWYKGPFGGLCHRLERDALFSLTVFDRRDTVLDAGCGTGVYLREPMGAGLDPVGLDGSEGMLRFACQAFGGGIRLVRGGLSAMPFRDGSFDKVLSVCALEFVADPSTVLSELARVLTAGGTMLVGFLNKNSPWAAARTEKGRDPGSVWHGARFYGLGDIGRLAGRLDLRFRGFRGAVHFPPDARGKGVSELEELEVRFALFRGVHRGVFP